jgi:hypothetical protein
MEGVERRGPGKGVVAERCYQENTVAAKPDLDSCRFSSWASSSS